MTDITILGRPVARFRFRSLQSWNEIFGGGHWRRGQGASKRWRKLGEEMGLKWRAAKGLESKRVEIWSTNGKHPKHLGHTYEPTAIQTRILIVVKVIRGTERRYDIHNVFVKALFDGFSDAGLWYDDEWAYVPMVLFTWATDTQGRGKHFLIEIHELNRFEVNGVAQQLPTGEMRHGEKREKDEGLWF